ncbi:SPARC-related modular calcium-binding protein 1-like isoform X4 [Dreissena polymorpha]|uniref:SPARC-related modular calcium-binding protein 1-like isoform X4 n=1 Tax=Dreissena polymorpha TaxID=45954 RepID=UPI00226463F8|nr:SPARC-related modular calcium-binding protein 1-like isoform X4 [Dreissena polymorpha]
MLLRAWLFVLMSQWIVFNASGTASLTVSEIQATGKVLFRALRDSEEMCNVKCKSRKPQIMCGSDGVSYMSKCEVKKARKCENKKISIVKMGTCSDTDVPVTKCTQEKAEALTSVAEGVENVFVPECNADGTFNEVQCHSASGFCWCVYQDGKPFPRTSTNSGTPNCKSKDKAENEKDSRQKIRVRRKKTQQNRKQNKKGKRCTSQEKATFNSNLVRVFTEEYNRSKRNSQNNKPDKKDPLIDTIEKQVVEWKFSQYDLNKDNLLQIKEVNALRRLVKKFIKPRSCAKRFLKFCDPDRNKLIERQEWSICLGVDINNGEAKRTTEAPIEATTAGEIERPPFPSLPAIKIDESRPRVGKDEIAEKNHNDCRTEREAALEQDRDNPDAGIFLPRCTPEGKWTQAQCHNSTGYCWCVDENTGKPIGGTSTQDTRPSCDFGDERKIEGTSCTYAEKQTFTAELINVISTEMKDFALNNGTNHSLIVTDPKQSIQERAARWRFHTLDENKNQAIDSGEIDVLKGTTLKNAQQKETRKCARRFVRYCDENDDKRITVDEWIECLGITRNININLPINPKRTGKNPFDKYLREN